MTDHHDVLAATTERLTEARAPLERKEQRIARLVASLIVVLALGLLSASIVAIVALEDRQNAINHLDDLKAQVADLKAQVHTNNGHIDDLNRAIVALQAQVRQLGGTPVVVNVEKPASASSTPSPTSTSTTAPSSPTTTTSTTQPPPRSHCVAGVCIVG